MQTCRNLHTYICVCTCMPMHVNVHIHTLEMPSTNCHRLPINNLLPIARKQIANAHRPAIYHCPSVK